MTLQLPRMAHFLIPAYLSIIKWQPRQQYPVPADTRSESQAWKSGSLTIMTRKVLMVFLVFLLAGSGKATVLRRNASMISNGMNNETTSGPEPSILLLGLLESSTVTCTPTYGFLPCTTVIWGNLFLIFVYEYLLSLAQKYITEGSELFFKMFGTGIFGASMFKVLGTFPPVLILLVNGLIGTTSTAETMSSMGLAMLAGSAVMMLTLQWGTVVAFGSHDLSQTSSSNEESSAARTLEASRPFSLTGFGVTQDADTKWISRLVLIAMIPFLILQLPQIVDSATVTSIAILVALILSAIGLIAYCTYEIFQPLIQVMTLEYIMQDFLQDKMFPGLLDADGKADQAALEQLFHRLNKNRDEEVSADELEALFLGVQLKELGLGSENYVTKLMKQFDKSENNKVSNAEFVGGMKQLLNGWDTGTSSTRPEEAEEALLSGEKARTATRPMVARTWLNYAKAGYFLVLGTAISVLLAQPLMEAIENFSDGLSIPSFIITYIIVPFAMSYKQILLAITSASKKTEKAVSLTFSMIYSGVFMSSMMSLTMFLLIVYVRDLTWDVSAGVLVVLLVGSLMGCLTSFRTTFPFWTCIVAFLLYPISLVLIYVLTTYCGWS